MVLVEELSLDTDPVLVTKLEVDTEWETPVLSAGIAEDGTFTHRLRGLSFSDETKWGEDKLTTKQSRHGGLLSLY